MANGDITTLEEGFIFFNPRPNALKLDEHDAALVAGVKAALDAAILSAHMPSLIFRTLLSDGRQLLMQSYRMSLSPP